MSSSTASRAIRIPPVPEDARTGRTLELLDLASRGRDRAPNIYTTLVTNPILFERWLGLAHNLLFDGSLTARDRELLVLRTAVNCDSEYEWAQHQRFAVAGGISEGEIAAIFHGWHDEPWTARERALLAAADELHVSSFVGDETWAVLADHYQPEQLIEITMVVGVYHLVAMLLNSLGVQLDEGLIGFPVY